MKKLFLLLAVIITFALGAAAQNRTITGSVVSADGDEPLTGATVMGVGTSIGVTTDIDGNFSLSLPASVKKLSVSYVGMTTKEVTITPSPMTIVLENSNVLDEVITVAYGTQKRSSFTGSASVLDASTIENMQVTNPVDALNGRVAGVQINNISGAPGSNPTIYVRGVSSINAGNEPLIVLDGTPFSGDLNTIATQDIESMTLLKDAASNALYGARGANGVILITTKKGKGNARVTFDAKWGANSKALQDYDVINTPKGYYEAYATSLVNQNNFGLAGKVQTGEALDNFVNRQLLGDLHYNVYGLPAGENLIVNGNQLNPNAVLGNVVDYNGTGYLLTPDNWEDYAYRKALRQEYSVSVSQATDKGSFYFSTNYLKNEGISTNSGFERLNARLSADIQAKPWLKVGANVAYSHYVTTDFGNSDGENTVGNVFAVSSQMPPIFPLFVRDAEGNIMRDDMGYQMMDYGDGMNAGLDRPVWTQANPLMDNILNVNKYNGNAFNGNAFAEIRFLHDFKFTTNNAFSLDETRYNSLTNPFYGSYADQNGAVTVEHMRTMDCTFQQLLNWTRSFGNNNFSVLLGHENYVLKSYDLYAMANNMLLPTNTELSGCISANQNGSSRSEYNTEGWFGRINYDFDGKYFASASYRRDASSRFHPDHRWGNFWSFGAAWIMNKEKFLQDQSWIDILKIKASYGEQGNDRIGNYRYISTFKIVNSDGMPAAEPSTLGNPDITWEKGGNFNAGVDFGFWNDRLGGTVEYFYRKTSDMLYRMPLPYSFGYTGFYDNIGDMVNQGVEIDLHGDVYRSKNITISLNANLTTVKNRITRLAEPSKTTVRDGVNGYSSGMFYYGEGKSLYTFSLPTYLGVDRDGIPSWDDQGNVILGEDGQPVLNKPTGLPMYRMTVTYTKKDENGKDIKDADGNPVTYTVEEVTTKYTDLNTSDYHLCGSALPKIYGGFGLYANIYGFDVTVDFNYAAGGKVYDSTYAGLMAPPTNTSQGAFHKDVLDAWSVDNPNAAQPRFVYGDDNMVRSSTRFLTSANYLSLQNINVGYTIPSKVTKKMQLEKIRFYFSADNVHIWSKRKGLDPRQSMAHTSDKQSVSGSSSASYYSPVRTFSGGINVSF
ncbi:MAG: TonB-dependent receptor [Duncaniella sp.]|nr:TonB-dependent receptor [Duncaniella sp.]